MGQESRYHKVANSARVKIGEFSAVNITVGVPNQDTYDAIQRAEQMSKARRLAEGIRNYLRQ